MISGIYISDYYKKNSLLRIYIKNKYVRLVPIAILSILGMIIFENIELVFSNMDKVISNIDVKQLIYSVFLVSDGWGLNYHNINSPLWYVCVLLICYYLVYIVLKVEETRRVRILRKVCLFFIIIGILLIEFKPNYPLLNHNCGRAYVSFFLGIILSDKEIKNSKLTIFILFTIVFISIGVVWSLEYNEILWKVKQYICIFITYPCVIIISNSVHWKNNKIIFLLSSSTYSVYCWHFPLIVLISKMYSMNIIQWDIYRLKNMLIFGIIIWLFGLLSYMFVEKPIRNWLQ